MTTTFVPDSTSAPGAPARRSSEAGSAYLAVLLVLVVMTILGLSLAVITQTEVLIGGSEKQATRQLFAADSGVHLSLAYQLVKGLASRKDLRIASRDESLLGYTTRIDDVVCTTALAEIAVTACNLCMLNQEPKFKAVHYAVTATALRRGGATLGARKTLGAVTAVEPYLPTFGGFQFDSDEHLKTRDGLTMDIDTTTEVDPCEALFLKI